MSTWDKERYANDPIFQAKVKASSNAWKQANRSKFNACRREQYANDPKFVEAVRNSWLKTAYGITLRDYNAMVERQDGLCGSCRRRPTEKLHVDHCHETQMLRLLLCRTCNIGFGYFGDDPDLMRAGADYLEIWRIIHARRLAAGHKPTPIRTSKPKKRKDTKCPPASPRTTKPMPRV